MDNAKMKKKKQKGTFYEEKVLTQKLRVHRFKSKR